MALLSEAEKQKIAQAVALAESKTSGEIVVSYVRRSGTYRWIDGLAALKGAFMGTLVAVVLHSGRWDFSPWNLLVWQSAGAFFYVALVQIPFLRRLPVSKKEFAVRTHAGALQVFLESGVMRTRDRTGVLIYVSEFEHRVEILADQGIHSVLDNQYWNAQVELIVAGIRANRACEALCEAVAQIGSKLSEKFPIRADDTNELPNQPL